MIKHIYKTIILLFLIIFNPTYSEIKQYNIKLQGLYHFTEDNVINNLDLKHSKYMIKSLYNKGLFNNITLYKYKNNIIINIDENPIIHNIKINGNFKKCSEDDIYKILNTLKINHGYVFHDKDLFKFKHILILKYLMMGDSSIKIDIKTIEYKKKWIDIIINILEENKKHINNINFSGNKYYTNNQLLEVIHNINSIDSLHQRTFSVESLKEYYINNGFINFKINNLKNILLSKDKKQVFVEFNLNEGKMYQISNIFLKGELSDFKEELKKIMIIKKGDFLSNKDILNNTQLMINYLKNKGYALVTIYPYIKIDKENNKIKIIFDLKKIKKIYINKINFLVNNKLNDNLYINCIKYNESDIYSKTLINESRKNIENLSYVENVNVHEFLVPGSHNLINILYDVKEINNHSVRTIIGYSKLYNLIMGIDLNFTNILGRGHKILIHSNLSKLNKTINIDYKTPILQSKMHQNIKMYITHDHNKTFNHGLKQYGISIGYSINYLNYYLYISGVFENNTINKEDLTGKFHLLNLSNKVKNMDYHTFSLHFTFNYNTIGESIFPIKGKIIDLDGTFSLPTISDFEWYKIIGYINYFHAIDKNNFFILSIKGKLSYGNGYGNTNNLPVVENFYSGGWGSIRGFTQNSIGFSDTYTANNGKLTKNNPIGGNFYIGSNIDILFPINYFNKSNNIRLGIFYDIGNIYNTYTIPNYPDGQKWESSILPYLSNFRSSFGVELQWLSPIGKIGLSLAQPLYYQRDDTIQYLQFTIGKTF